MTTEHRTLLYLKELIKIYESHVKYIDSMLKRIEGDPSIHLPEELRNLANMQVSTFKRVINDLKVISGDELPINLSEESWVKEIEDVISSKIQSMSSTDLKQAFDRLEKMREKALNECGSDKSLEDLLLSSFEQAKTELENAIELAIKREHAEMSGITGRA